MFYLQQLDNIPFVSLCFCTFMALLTLIVFIWSLFKKMPMLIAFNKRMMSLWVLIILFVPVFIFDHSIACLFFAVLSLIALTEYRKMMFRLHPDQSQGLVLYVFLALQYIALYMDVQSMFFALIPFSIFLLIPFVGIVYRNDQEIWQKCTNDYIGLLLTVYAMSYMCAYITFPQMQLCGGKGLLLFVLILTLMGDFFQAICGFLWGKHFLVPSLSPHKTWEGLLGGGILTAILSWLMGIYLTPFSGLKLLCLGFILNIAAFCGDVTISAIKRYVGVKDCSNLLPGHGGLLDRFDSILLTSPIFFWYTMWCL